MRWSAFDFLSFLPPGRPPARDMGVVLKRRCVGRVVVEGVKVKGRRRGVRNREREVGGGILVVVWCGLRVWV